jgi:hypothetical protein
MMTTFLIVFGVLNFGDVLSYGTADWKDYYRPWGYLPFGGYVLLLKYMRERGK